MPGWDKDFGHFTEVLHRGYAIGLPGADAQYRMVPPNRARPNLAAIREEHNPRKAGVLALFYPVARQPYLVLMKRNTYPGVHSGQISLPGGQHETGDADIINTALRETHEEIGVPAKHVAVVGTLTELYIPPSNFLVQPVIGLAEHKPIFTPQEGEVERLMEVPLSEFLDPNNVIDTQVQARGTTFNVPAYRIEGEIIWGATAMILAEIMELLQRGGR